MAHEDADVRFPAAGGFGHQLAGEAPDAGTRIQNQPAAVVADFQARRVPSGNGAVEEGKRAQVGDGVRGGPNPALARLHEQLRDLPLELVGVGGRRNRAPDAPESDVHMR